MDTIIITDRSGNQVNVTQPLVNQVNVTQPLVNVIEVTALGPQGPKGNQGDQGDQGPSGSLQPSNSGSFEITGSLLISGSGTLTNVGPAVFSGSVNINLGSDQIGQKIDLSNGQTANAFQINSFGNTGGDLFRVESDGAIYGSTTGYVVDNFRTGKLLASYIKNEANNKTVVQINQSNGDFYLYNNVGIGTTSPNASLDVSGSAIVTGSITITNDLNTNDGDFSVRPLDLVPSIQGIYFKGTTGANWQIAATSAVTYVGANNNVQIWSNGIYRGSIQSAGWHIGDSQISPSAKLHTTLTSDVVGYRLDLSNGQTEDAFQINSFGNTGGDLFGIESDGLIRSQIATSNTIGQVHHNFPNAYSITNLTTLTSNKYSAFFGYYTGVKHQGLHIGANSTGTGFIQNIDGTSAYRFAIQPYGAGLTIGSTTGMPNNKTFEVNGDSYFKDNVGIGTTNPLYGLDVSGNKYRVNIGDSSTNGEIWFNQTWAALYTDGTQTRIEGRTGHAYTLGTWHIGGSSWGAGLLMVTSKNGLDAFNITMNHDEVAQRIDLSNGQTADAFQINSYGNTGGDLFNITGDGKVGIGVYPSVGLHVSSDEISFVAKTSTNMNMYITPSAGKHFSFYNIRQNSDFIFKQSVGGSVGTTTFIIKGDTGNVGIGATSPTGLLSGSSKTVHLQSSGNNAEYRTTTANKDASYFIADTLNTHGYYTTDVLSFALRYGSASSFFHSPDGNTVLGSTDFKPTSNQAKLKVIADTDIVAQRIDLSNGQTADAFQINSYGNTGGDLFRILDDGKVSIGGAGNTVRAFMVQDTDGNGFQIAQDTSSAAKGLVMLQDSSAHKIIGYENKPIDFYRGSHVMRINTTGSVGIGTTSIDASAKFQIDSTTQGALLPRMTTTQRDAIPSPATGLLIFNTTTKKLDYYSGTAWGQV